METNLTDHIDLPTSILYDRPWLQTTHNLSIVTSGMRNPHLQLSDPLRGTRAIPMSAITPPNNRQPLGSDNDTVRHPHLERYFIPDNDQNRRSAY